MEKYGILFWMNKNAFYRCRRRELMWNGWGGKKRKKTQNQQFNWWVNKNQLVSGVYLIVIRLFCGEEVGVGSETLADKKTGWRVGWGQGQADRPIFHCSFFAFSTLHSQKMWDYNYSLKELQCTCLQQASKWKLQLLKKYVSQWRCCHHLNFSSFFWLFFSFLYCYFRKH